MTKINIDDLTLGQLKQLQSLNNLEANDSLNYHIGKKVIIRTYSAGVHFGTLKEKAGKEVLLINSRRLYQFWCAKSISLSGVAVYGINQSKSRICPTIEEPLWLEAIEIIPCTDIAIKSIEGAEDVEAK